MAETENITLKYPVFYYRGISCEQMGLWWMPDAKGMLDDLAEIDVSAESVTGRPGKYWYNTETKEREFILDCFYENLTRPQIEKIYRWIRSDSQGELVFGERPWCHYNVRPTKRITGERYRGVQDAADGQLKYSGKMQITFTAFEPFAIMDVVSYAVGQEGSVSDQMEMSGIISTDMMPVIQKESSMPQILYNPGTERTNMVKITIAGTVGENGLTIRNLTTGDECKLTSLPPNNRELVIDSYVGTVTYKDNGEYAFYHHNYGYQTLAGCGFFRRLKVRHGNSATIITSNGDFYKTIDQGQYMYVDGDWHRILHVNSTSEQTIMGDAYPPGFDPEDQTRVEAVIASMNQIQLIGTGVNLTKFSIDFTPLTR